MSDLNIARWYPTLAPLEDGNVLAVSGLDGFGQMIKGNTEEWTPKTRAWTSIDPSQAVPDLPGAVPDAQRRSVLHRLERRIRARNPVLANPWHLESDHERLQARPGVADPN